MSSLVTAAIIAAGLLAGSVQSVPSISNERDQFVSVCLPRMSTRIQKQPEAVCGCLHDNAVSKVEDAELRIAVIRGIAETGVPSVQYSWVPNKTPEFVVETLDKVAAPTLACMYGPR
jgi:hypothetical protein